MNKSEFKTARVRMQEVATRLREIDKWLGDTKDKVTQEKRDMNDEENKTFESYSSEKDALVREKDILRLSVEAYKAGVVPAEREFDAKRAFTKVVCAIKNNRSIPSEFADIVKGRDILIPETRDAVITDTSDIAPMIPLTIGDIIQPLNNKIIYNKIGMKMQYGLKGDFVYPILAQCTADFEGENVQLTDKQITMSSLKPTPQRVGLTIPVSNTAIDEASYSLQDIVIGQIQQAIANLLNKWMFSATKLTSDSTGGCMLAALATPAITTATAGIATWTEVLQLEASVMESGVIIDSTAAFVCNSTMLALLKGTPKETNTAQFIAEGNAANCTIDGFPVFITEDMPTGALGFGVFNYNLLGQFGEARLIVDPYTLAASNQTRFTFNTRFANLVMRNAAFASLALKTA